MRVALLMLLAPLMLTGCVVSNVERESLPTGVTLLDSDQGVCDGPLQIEDNPNLIVEESEDITFVVDDEDDIDWQCLTDSYPRDGEADCPDGTSYVRVSREEDEAEFTLECFGA